ncbi:hypothetical protein [Legionella bononiensis]|uniref:hypothetical protein n=1 Tax=Legionella bononiensis TaxID=2793102 RepID=UPI0019347660|nr:hypothetical protein [Legionella bononiensis]MBL7478779.1 hypothetical protein [Legionella bononiensis]MBL7562497.1 hypothetical protein [Legionella bononiensis]
MEQDRYSINNKMYVLGIISLILALGLFFFSMYILPFLIWNLYYDVPDLVSNIIMFFENRYEYSEAASRVITWLIFFLPSLMAGYISYYISNYIDDQILGLAKKVNPELEKETTIEHQKDVKESLGLAAKIILLMILIVAVIFLLQIIIQSTA